MEEIMKLAEMLEAVGAEYTLLNRPRGGMQIVLMREGEKVDDCVFAPGISHGWEDGLLESCRLSDCDGYETATEIFDGWEKMMLEYNDEG